MLRILRLRQNSNLNLQLLRKWLSMLIL